MKHIADWIAATWAAEPWLVVVAAGLAAALVVALLIAAIRLVAKTIRAVLGAAPNLKLLIGQAVVQAGVTWAVVTGTYAFCERYFKLPDWEAGAFAAFLEAATWVTVGMIYDHGKSTDQDGTPSTGFGSAGPFFWLFSVLGGFLAVLAGTSVGAMIGRAVIVVFGTCLWYLALLRVTRRSGTPSRFRWTPRAALVAIGALAPADQDVRDEHQEWQIRRMARAMRWANGRWPWSWLGTRMLTGRAEQAHEDVIAAARRRYAVAHVVVSSVRPDSEVMRRIIADVERNPGEPVSAELRADLDEIRIGARMVTTRLRAQVDQIRAADAATRMVHGVRMPAAIADQIPDQIPQDWLDRFRSNRVDQPPAAALDQAQTTDVGQTPDQHGPTALVHTPAAPVDQTPTSGTIPAARPAPARRTTVRVEQVRPVSPAPAGEIPPRVHAMVQALRDAYPDQVPGRRTVMDHMGWTSAGDAQTAINLVRAERAAKTEKEQS